MFTSQRFPSTCLRCLWVETKCSVRTQGSSVTCGASSKERPLSSPTALGAPHAAFSDFNERPLIKFAYCPRLLLPLRHRAPFSVIIVREQEQGLARKNQEKDARSWPSQLSQVPCPAGCCLLKDLARSKTTHDRNISAKHAAAHMPIPSALAHCGMQTTHELR